MNKGQAIPTLLFFLIVGTTIASATAVVMAVNLLSTSRINQGMVALSAAEAGVENAILMLLRDPAFSETQLTIDDIKVKIKVESSGSRRTVISEAVRDNLRRTVEVEAEFKDEKLHTTSWQEVF